MAVIIPVAGGKGGVGKSVVSINLSVALAAKCKRVVLCDLDLGGANLHTMLGLKNNQAGFGNYINRMENNINELIQVTGIPNLYFIAGDCLFPGTANMDFFIKVKIIRELQKIDCDFLIVDLGAGTAHNVIDFYLMAYDSVLVVTPEITSVLNAYSFLKSAVYRFCYRLFAPKSEERTIFQNSFLQRIEGKEYSLADILKNISAQFPESGELVIKELAKWKPRAIMNMGKNPHDGEMGIRLRNLAKNKLSVELAFIGFLPYDDSVQFAIAHRQPVAQLYPESLFSRALFPVIERLTLTANRGEPLLHDAPEDFSEQVKNYFAEHIK